MGSGKGSGVGVGLTEEGLSSPGDNTPDEAGINVNKVLGDGRLSSEVVLFPMLELTVSIKLLPSGAFGSSEIKIKTPLTISTPTKNNPPILILLIITPPF